jgi:hypothetical protein
MEMEIYRYVDSDKKDAYDNPIKSYVYYITVPVDFQASSRRDKLTEAGEILQDTYKIYVDVNVEINPNDIFRDPDGNTYTIIGTPIANNRFSSTKHKKIELQKTNKPIKVVVQ